MVFQGKQEMKDKEVQVNILVNEIKENYSQQIVQEESKHCSQCNNYVEEISKLNLRIEQLESVSKNLKIVYEKVQDK